MTTNSKGVTNLNLQIAGFFLWIMIHFWDIESNKNGTKSWIIILVFFHSQTSVYNCTFFGLSFLNISERTLKIVPHDFNFISKIVTKVCAWNCVMLEFNSNYLWGGLENEFLGASLVAQMVKNPPAVQETQVWSLG